MAAKTCIIILGMHRSGTSALTRLCALAGAELPRTLIRSRSGNKTGHWESEAITAFHDEMLASMDQRWDDFRPVEFTPAQRNQYRKQFSDLIERDFGDAAVIVLKEPRMARFAALTLSALDAMGYRVCIMHAVRRPLEVARSLKKRNKIPMVLGALYWLRHVVDIETALQDRPHTVLPYNMVMDDGAGSIRRFFSDNDLPDLPDSFEQEATKFLDPSLRHHTVTHWSDAPELSSWLQPVHDALCSNAPRSPGGKTLKDIIEIRDELEAASGPLNALRQQFETQQARRVRSDAKVKTLRAEVTARRSQLEEAKTFNDQISQDVIQLQAEVTARRSQLEEAKTFNDQISQDVIQLQAEVTARRSQLEEAKTFNDQISQDVIQLQADLRNAQTKLNETQTKLTGEIQVLRQQFETQQARRVKSDAKVKTLRAEVAVRRSQLEEAKTFNDQISQDVIQLQADLRNAQTKLNETQTKLTGEIQILSAQKEAAETHILELETLVEFEAARASASADHITAMQSSNSWRITKPARNLVRLWRNKTRLIVGMMAGLQARQLMQSGDIVASANASQSPAIRDARRALQRERSMVLDRQWLLLAAHKQIDDTDLPAITVSAVTYNSECWLPKFFKSLTGLDYPKDKLSIHFVDHGSSDGTINRIEAFLAKQRATYCDLKLSIRDNLGYGAGNDYAIRASSDDFVLVTNVDVEFYPASLRQCAAFACADTEDVACWEFRQTPYEHPKYYDPVTLETNWNAHACVLIRQSAYVDVGGYDTRIFMYGEDVELSYRFRAKGYRLRYVPRAIVLHHVELDNANIRPNQLSGSIAANILLRYRYGSPMDVTAGEALLQASLRNEIDPVRAKALETAKHILRENRWHFWWRRGLASFQRKGRTFFPFNEFDYDVARIGADIVSDPFKQTDFEALPRVSIITRTHGPSDAHLRNAIACVLNQTYPNIEHIIVEDSTDDARELAEAAAAQFGDDRIRYAKSPGKGRSECGNHGASIARGEWLGWLDNDDLLFADHVETLIRAAQSQPEAVTSYALAWDAHSEMVDGDPLMHQFELPNSHRRGFDQQTLMRENFIPIQSILFRKSLFDRFGGFNPEFSKLEDWNLWIRYSQIGPFIFTPKVTSIYLTPFDNVARQNRHIMLHEAYDPVSQANARDVAKIRQTLKSASKSVSKRKQRSRNAS